MKKSNRNSALGALAIVGIALAAKKAMERKSVLMGILNDFDIKEKNPFSVADKIREMDDEKYNEFKNRMKSSMPTKCCCKGSCKA